MDDPFSLWCINRGAHPRLVYGRRYELVGRRDGHVRARDTTTGRTRWYPPERFAFEPPPTIVGFNADTTADPIAVVHVELSDGSVWQCFMATPDALRDVGDIVEGVGRIIRFGQLVVIERPGLDAIGRALEHLLQHGELARVAKRTIAPAPPRAGHALAYADAIELLARCELANANADEVEALVRAAVSHPESTPIECAGSGFRGERASWIEARLAEYGYEVQVQGEPEAVHACPICRYRTLSERYEYEICRVCFWEDDGSTRFDRYSGPNHCTPREAREAFERYGACSLRSLRFVVPDRDARFERADRSDA